MVSEELFMEVQGVLGKGEGIGGGDVQRWQPPTSSALNRRDQGEDNKTDEIGLDNHIILRVG